jgi:hypothetical protein
MDQDPASSNLASYRPDMSAVDKLRDILAEPFLLHTDLEPHTVYNCIDEGMESANLDDSREKPMLSEGVIAMLRLVATDENTTLALRATCYLRLFGAEGRSFDEIGEYFGKTRGCVQEIYSNIQARHRGIKSRADKSDESREKSRRMRTGFRKQRTQRTTPIQWKRTPLLPLLITEISETQASSS